MNGIDSNPSIGGGWRFARLPLIFALLFCGGGLIFSTIGWTLILIQHYRLATYLPVQAKILASTVRVDNNLKGGDTYVPAIRYEYQVGGRMFHSSRVLPMGNFSSSGSWAWRVKEQYPVGLRTTAFYSPRDPSSAFLSREARGTPHFFALFALPFIAVGVYCLFAAMQGRRVVRAPTAQRDGWFQLQEQGTIRFGLLFYSTATLLWFAYIAVVVGDYLAVNGEKLDALAGIPTAIGTAIGIVGIVFVRKYWRLQHDFLNAEVCISSLSCCVGDSIKARLRQGLRQPLEIDELLIGALCMRSDRARSGTSVTYQPAVDVAHCWRRLEVNRQYSAGSEVAAVANLDLPPNAPPSSTPRSSDYPIFQWFIVIRVIANAQPPLVAWFPLQVAGIDKGNTGPFVA